MRSWSPCVTDVTWESWLTPLVCTRQSANCWTGCQGLGSRCRSAFNWWGPLAAGDQPVLVGEPALGVDLRGERHARGVHDGVWSGIAGLVAAVARLGCVAKAAASHRSSSRVRRCEMLCRPPKPAYPLHSIEDHCC